MTAIICNSTRWGGTGGLFAVASSCPRFEGILTHEFGHSFGNLSDEYWYPNEAFSAEERINKTNNGNLSTIKWRHLMGYSGIYGGIGAYRYSNNSADIAYNWFKPHESCHMQFTYSEFCAVCASELIRLMEVIAGNYFDISIISSNNIRIDDVNYTIYGRFEIPPVINGKIVSEIGGNAFRDQSMCNEFIIPGNITKIGASAFLGCTNLLNVDFEINSYLNQIEDYAFKNCINLESISIPESLNIIGKTPFADCASLYGFVIPNLITTDQHKWINSEGNIIVGNHNYINGVCNICGHEGSGTHVHLYSQYSPSPPGKFLFQHNCICDCGYTKKMPCIGIIPIDPPYDVYCINCGQYMGEPEMLFSITLPNGDICVSHNPITFESAYLVAMKLGISYEYSDFLIAIQPSYFNDIKIYILPKKYSLNT